MKHLRQYIRNLLIEATEFDDKFIQLMDQYQERWETEDQARKGHVEIMAMVQDPMISDDI